MDAERAERLSIGQETGQADKLAFEGIQRIRREGFQKVSALCSWELQCNSESQRSLQL